MKHSEKIKLLRRLEKAVNELTGMALMARNPAFLSKVSSEMQSIQDDLEIALDIHDEDDE